MAIRVRGWKKAQRTDKKCPICGSNLMLERKDVKARGITVKNVKMEVCRSCGYTEITDEGLKEVQKEYKRIIQAVKNFFREPKPSNVMGYMSLNLVTADKSDDMDEFDGIDINISPDEIEIYDEDEEIRKELEKYKIVSHLKEVVEGKNIPISSIAKRLGVSPQRVYDIIKGKNIPTLENAFKLVKILGVEKIEDLYEYKKIEESKDL